MVFSCQIRSCIPGIRSNVSKTLQYHVKKMAQVRSSFNPGSASSNWETGTLIDVTRDIWIGIQKTKSCTEKKKNQHMKSCKYPKPLSNYALCKTSSSFFCSILFLVLGRIFFSQCFPHAQQKYTPPWALLEIFGLIIICSAHWHISNLSNSKCCNESSTLKTFKPQM